MKSSFFRVLLFSLSVLFLMRGVSLAQYEQTVAANPPIAQPLVREGDLAVRLVEVLNLGMPASEAEEESMSSFSKIPQLVSEQFPTFSNK